MPPNRKAAGHDPADGERVGEACIMHYARPEEDQRRVPHDEAEIDRDTLPDPDKLQRGEHAVLAGPQGFRVAGEVGFDQCPLLRCQPVGLGGAVGKNVAEEEDGDEPCEDRRDTLQQEHPLPAVPAVHAVQAGEDRPGQRPADHPGDGRSRHEEAEHPRPPRARIPVGEVQDHAWEEAGLEHSEEEAQHVEEGRRGHEHHRHAAGAPEERDPRDGLAGADMFQKQVARHFAQEVADEEDARADAVDRLAEFEIGQHLQLGEADIDPVDPGQDPEHHQERQQAPGDPAVGRVE